MKYIITLLLISVTLVGRGQNIKILPVTKLDKVWSIRTITGIDSNYLEMTSDSIFTIHGDTQYVLKDLTKREANAWEKYYEMSNLHDALVEIVQTLNSDTKTMDKALAKYMALARRYHKIKSRK